MKLVLVRHATPLVATGVCYGRLDVPLTPQAAEEVPAVAARLARLGAVRVWSSPLQRCLVLGQAVARLGGCALTVDLRLAEYDFGAWEGRAWDDLPRAALDRWATDPVSFAPPGGESGAVVLGRVRAVFADISAAAEDCIVISHGGPLRLLRALAEGRAPDLLEAPPPIGSVMVLTVQPPARAPSTTHSASTLVAPSRSPV